MSKAKTPEEPVRLGPNRWVCKVTDGWLPLPEAAIASLGWKEGDDLEILPIMADEKVRQVLIRKVGALSNG